MKEVTKLCLPLKHIFKINKPTLVLGLGLLAGLAFPELSTAQRPDRSSNQESHRPDREAPRSAAPGRERNNRNTNPRPEPAPTPRYQSQPERPRSRDLAYNGNHYQNYRRPLVYNAPNHYRSPNWNYRNLPRRGYVAPFAPSSSITIAYGGVYFRFDNGVYYRPINGRYVVVPPPIGLRIRVIPNNYFRLYVGQRPYYYYYGTYYEPRDGYYEVVRPPVGALVESIPDGYEQLVIDGETYYVVDGVQYKPVLHNNEIWYEVLKVN